MIFPIMVHNEFIFNNRVWGEGVGMGAVKYPEFNESFIVQAVSHEEPILS